jgi:hypothetical protein
LEKNHTIANNSAIFEAEVFLLLGTDLESLEFLNIFYACLTKFENYQILLDKISHIYILATKLFSG